MFLRPCHPSAVETPVVQTISAVLAPREKFRRQWFDGLTTRALAVRWRVQRIYWLDLVVMIPMIAVARKQCQVLRSVVVTNTIDVMHDFGLLQQATQCVLHH